MMSDTISTNRAEMPMGTTSVLDTRSVEKSNANLLGILKPGQYVLDVGCGSGAITSGICEQVGDKGKVIGVDRSETLINQARDHFSGIRNLTFFCTDILAFETDLFFDVITTARTLQWVSNPGLLLNRMKSLLKPDGVLCVLDYDHTAIQWNPAPPVSMLHFYQAFLKWRADAGMDNRIGGHVASMLEQCGLKLLLEQDQSEYFERGETDFMTHINIWMVVAETRGKQMVDDNYITEEQRLLALKEYQNWCGSEAKSMRLVLKVTHAGNKQL